MAGSPREYGVPQLGPKWLVLALIALTLASTAVVSADEWIELRVPLTEGRYYSPRELYRQFNEQGGSDYELEHVSDQRRELRPASRAALLLADRLGLAEVNLGPDTLVLRVPDRESDGARRRQRQRLARWLDLELEAWPDHFGLRVPDDFEAGRRTILFIHGMEATEATWSDFEEACEQRGIQTLTFRYPNDGPPAWAGDRLGEELTALAVEHPEAELVVVAHSMGGLVARYALEQGHVEPGLVSDIFMLGTPHAGSVLAGAQPHIELIFTIGRHPLEPWAGLQEGLGEAGVDLQPGSRFLATLDAGAKPEGVEYHVGIGERGLFKSERQAPLRDAAEVLMKRRDVPAATRRRVQRVLESDELFNGRGDGAVSVASAALASATTKRRFARNHLGLVALTGDEPAEDEIFHWIIETLAWTGEDAR